APRVDLRGALDPAAAETYLPNDSHWSHEGARRAALATAEAARAAFPGGLPGRPLKTRFTEGPERRHRGDLQRMLGFVEGGAADEALRAPTRTVAGVGPDGKPPVAAKGEPIVVCGTSFSRSFDWPALVGAALERRVTDAAVAGQGPTVTLLELARAVSAGERAAPELIVWEFPEKHCFTRPQEFLRPLEAFAAEARAELAYDPATARPLAYAKRELREIADAGDDGGVLRGSPSPPRPGAGFDPQVIYDLAEPLPGDGSLALVVTVRSKAATDLKVYLDWGRVGFFEPWAKKRRVAGGGASWRFVVPLQGEDPDVPLTRLRIDPANSETAFELDPPALWERRR
ncbi:MAG TPA: hypothetical protein VEI02_09585, partial [Planctomycetota bacterium]|nr:hypothetical protein [Planctomycetota bacterium]